MSAGSANTLFEATEKLTVCSLIPTFSVCLFISYCHSKTLNTTLHKTMTLFT